MKHFLSAFLVVTVLFTFAGFSKVNAEEYNTQALNEQAVMATLWYQKSAELRALSYQAYNFAKLILDADLRKGPSEKKRAIAIDIDDTLVDNSPYQAGLVGKNYGYSKGWGEWVHAGEMRAMAGAVEFLNYVSLKGVDIFYISNLKNKYRESTKRNLAQLGFPQVRDDNLLLREKTSDKEPRRMIARKNHRIVLMIGDNLNDFDNIFRGKSVDDRLKAVDLLKDKFGIKFIVIPNPTYGEWEGAVYNFNWRLSPKEKSDARKAAMDRWNMD
jgi:5'-nucleotidase (lipoprotein e(P4) family)